ncbi:CPBP family intramembrane glutamic endopeptidase [Lacrimispora sp.]|uniref:CPBP family intramembrane glutamic endopeptidase n=1 Tax=Lacrimispora sp. TaxID=2719234 RepID=UPI00289A39A9|nr:type II CAAX endopeptidase family protein [Lacrimispora sp.]
MERQKNYEKTQMFIFLGVAFALPYMLGILMGIGYTKGLDVSVFPSAQMFYPASGAILAALITHREDHLLPKRFFIGFLILTLLLLVCTVASIIVPGLGWNVISQYLMILGSVIAWILLLTEKKDKRIAYGLRGGRWKTAAHIILLYLILYFGRTVIMYILSGQIQTMTEIMQKPVTWLMLLTLPINYFLIFIAFLGEEYGWRYFLQPILQKKFGMVRGVLVLGIAWGVWHLPINFFYYSSPSVGIISLTGQLITCVTLGIFYGWAYLKTDNIWTVVILHFVNNNLVPIITGNYTEEVLQNQDVTWNSVIILLVVNTLLFASVIFTSYYRDDSRRLPTMDERVDRQMRKLEEQAQWQDAKE